MPFDPQRHHRRSIRLKGYNYAQLGAYFVTISVEDHVHLFGEVVDADMQLNPYGRVAATFWERIPRHFPRVELGVWVIMPNHVHGIIIITDDDGRGEAFPDRPNNATVTSDFESTSSTLGDDRNASPLRATTMPHAPMSGSLGAIVGNYKSITARRINRMRQTPGARVWQRNYHEHIVRDADDWDRIQAYIENNLERWEQDRFYGI